MATLTKNVNVHLNFPVDSYGSLPKNLSLIRVFQLLA
jgi:hypothetical protein